MKKHLLALAVCASFSPFLQAKPVPKPHRTQTQNFSGLASWYGNREQGHKMANGSRFDRNAFTAASRSLPFGTRLHIINQSNGLSVEVTVTDRGPWSNHRILDMAEAPAKTIGCIKQGVCRIDVSIIKEQHHDQGICNSDGGTGVRVPDACIRDLRNQGDERGGVGTGAKTLGEIEEPPSH